MARRKRKTGRISVFKGREAKLNRAIFQILALKGPQTIYDIYKEVRKQKRLANTKYPVVNRRVRILEQLNYLEKVGTRKTKAGFVVALHQLTLRGYLAILLNQTSIDDFIQNADENVVITAIAILASLKHDHLFLS